MGHFEDAAKRASAMQDDFGLIEDWLCSKGIACAPIRALSQDKIDDAATEATRELLKSVLKYILEYLARQYGVPVKPGAPEQVPSKDRLDLLGMVAIESSKDDPFVQWFVANGTDRISSLAMPVRKQSLESLADRVTTAQLFESTLVKAAAGNEDILLMWVIDCVEKYYELFGHCELSLSGATHYTNDDAGRWTQTQIYGNAYLPLLPDSPNCPVSTDDAYLWQQAA